MLNILKKNGFQVVKLMIEIFKEDDGTPLITRFDPTKELLIMSITQA